MAFTKATLIRQALETLGVLGAGQSVQAEDAAKVGVILDGLVFLLQARKVISLSSELASDSFPDELLLPLSQILARHAAPAYGIGGQDLAAIKLVADEAEMDIKSMQPTGRGAQPTPALYF